MQLSEPHRTERLCRLAGKRRTQPASSRMNPAESARWANAYLAARGPWIENKGHLAEWIRARELDRDTSTTVFRNLILWDSNKSTSLMELDLVVMDAQGGVRIEEVKTKSSKSAASARQDIDDLRIPLSNGARLFAGSLELTQTLGRRIVRADRIETKTTGPLGRMGFDFHLPLTSGDLTAAVVLIQEAHAAGAGTINNRMEHQSWDSLIRNLPKPKKPCDYFGIGVVDESI